MQNSKTTTYHDNLSNSTNTSPLPLLVWRVGNLINPKTTYHDTTTYKHKKRYDFRS